MNNRVSYSVAVYLGLLMAGSLMTSRQTAAWSGLSPKPVSRNNRTSQIWPSDPVWHVAPPAETDSRAKPTDGRRSMDDAAAEKTPEPAAP